MPGPERDFCPLAPRPAVPPYPEPCPRPTRFCYKGAGYEYSKLEEKMTVHVGWLREQVSGLQELFEQRVLLKTY